MLSLLVEPAVFFVSELVIVTSLLPAVAEIVIAVPAFRFNAPVLVAVPKIEVPLTFISRHVLVISLVKAMVPVLLGKV